MTDTCLICDTETAGGCLLCNECGGQDGPDTTIQISSDLHERMMELKPSDDTTFDELLQDMADAWEEGTT